MYSPRSSSRKRFSAFTLTELLVVIGIMAMILGLLVPVVGSMKGAGDVTKAAADVKNVLESARSYARANNTYVWVGFHEESTSGSSTDPVGRVVISTVASKDGTFISSGAAPIDPTRLTQVNKLVKIDNMHLNAAGSGDQIFPVGDGSGDNLESRPPVVDRAVQFGDLADDPTLAGSLSTFLYPVDCSGTAQYTFKKVIQFTPRGEARVNDTIWPIVEVGLQPARGSQIDDANPNVVAIQCSGIAGNVKTYRR